MCYVCRFTCAWMRVFAYMYHRMGICVCEVTLAAYVTDCVWDLRMLRRWGVGATDHLSSGCESLLCGGLHSAVAYDCVCVFVCVLWYGCVCVCVFVGLFFGSRGRERLAMVYVVMLMLGFMD